MKNRTKFRIGFLARALALVLLTAVSASAQEEQTPRTLELKTTLSDSLPPKATHSYTIEATADQFIYGVVTQISVDVVVTVQGPDGQTIRTFDSPARGPEPFHFDSGKPGVYRIDVKPFKEETGRYSIELKRLEPKAEDPRRRVDQLVTPYIGDNTPGAVVAIVEDGKITFSKGYGLVV